MKNLVIWKYPIETEDDQHIQMPKKAKILCVQVQRNQPCLWALVNPDAEKVARQIFVKGTGHPIELSDNDPKDYFKYIGTYQLESLQLVYHVFDGGEWS